MNIRNIFLTFFFVCTFLVLHAGEVLTGRSHTSNILGREVKFSVYLPQGYDAERSQPYPVLYLLHGLSDDYTAWVEKGNIKQIADSLVVPMVIVMPDAWDSWYVNDILGKCRYEDMFFQEFIPFVQSQYHLSEAQKDTYIAGLSMGGNGSLLYCLRHPGRFGVCGALSPAVLTNEELQKRFNGLFGRLFGSDMMGYYRQYSVLDLIPKIPDQEKGGVCIYIDCGDDDFLYRGNDALHTTLRNAKIPHEYRVRDGDHNWAYWQSGIPEILKLCNSVYRGKK